MLAHNNIAFVNLRCVLSLCNCKDLRKKGAEVYIFETLRDKVGAGLFYRILAAFIFTEGVDLHAAGG